jgi:competence protein ComEA
VRLSSRRSDDADVIRARLRALLDDVGAARGWVPDDPDENTGASDVPTAVAAVETESDGGLPSGIGRHRAPGEAARWDPGRLGARSLWAAGLVAALVLIGWTWWDRPRVEPAPTAPAATEGAARSSTATPTVGEVAETSATVVVSVVGLVARPGLVTLPSGSRVADAVERAGGLLPGTDPASINLAAVVTDGQQIAVGMPGAAGPVAGGTGSGPSGDGGRVDLNTATVGELDALPGIGPVLAQRIVDHRTSAGPFRSVDELDDVPGIGPAIAAELAALVSV